MTTELRETEQKFEGDASIALPPLQGLPGVATVSQPETQTLVAEYYDCEGLRLLLAGVTLRRREGGADEGWHLKLPDATAGRVGRAGEMTSRHEVRLSLARGDRDRRERPADGEPVPGELARLVRVHTRGGALRPVARIETRRRTTTLRDAAGESLAEIAVDEVAAQTLGQTTTLVRWNEVEAELTGGGPRLARAVSGRLRRSGLHPAGYHSKLEHVMAVSPHARAGARRADGGRADGRADGIWADGVWVGGRAGSGRAGDGRAAAAGRRKQPRAAGSAPGASSARRHPPARSCWPTSTPRRPAWWPLIPPSAATSRTPSTRCA